MRRLANGSVTNEKICVRYGRGRNHGVGSDKRCGCQSFARHLHQHWFCRFGHQPVFRRGPHPGCSQSQRGELSRVRARSGSCSMCPALACCNFATSSRRRRTGGINGFSATAQCAIDTHQRVDPGTTGEVHLLRHCGGREQRHRADDDCHSRHRRCGRRVHRNGEHHNRSFRQVSAVQTGRGITPRPACHAISDPVDCNCRGKMPRLQGVSDP